MGEARHLTYRDRNWAPQPDAEAPLRGWLGERLARNPAAAAFAGALMQGTAIRLHDLVDHVVFADTATPAAILCALHGESILDQAEAAA